ncbi:MAG: Crp/Fnr family transcriptional regulator [Alphaproteobacteria bacterium]|nr:Crp/Fnr family transcriptional regulator [Alphaproteobacteria bacterium]
MPLQKSDYEKLSVLTEGDSLPRLLRGLSTESLDYILDASTSHSVEAGRILVQQGDSPEFVFLVLSGTVRTLRIDDTGKEATIRMLQPADTCMEAVLFMGSPSPITVQAVTESRLIFIPENIVKTLAARDAMFANNLLQIVTYHYKNAMYQIEAMNIKTPIQRVGYYLLVKFLERGKGNLEFFFPFRKSMVANYLGMTAETFSRTLCKMKNIGITIGEDKVQMKTSHDLCLFCDSDTESLCAEGSKKSYATCPRHKKSG